MPLAAKNEAEKDNSTRILTPAEQLQTMKKPWLLMDGEKTFWYNRFNRYRALGAKRSLQAAFEQEQQSIRALKSIEQEQKAAEPGVEKVSHRTRTRASKAPHLVEVAKPKLVLQSHLADETACGAGWLISNADQAVGPPSYFTTTLSV